MRQYVSEGTCCRRVTLLDLFDEEETTPYLQNTTAVITVPNRDCKEGCDVPWRDMEVNCYLRGKEWSTVNKELL